MTLGQIRMQLRQRHPGISLDLLDQFIQDRHQQILDSMSWSRLKQEQAILTTAEYSTGTVTAGEGALALQGDGTTWDATMNGRIVRIAERSEFYAFTFTSETEGALDRGYEGETEADLAYRINRNLYTLDSNVRSVDGVRLATGPLRFIPLAELNALSPGRNSYGQPTHWTWQMDAESDPPQLQIELWPVPTEVLSVYLSVTLDQSGLEQGVTSSTLLAWERPACLMAGVEADILAHMEKLPGAQQKEARFQTLLTDMRRVENERQGPRRLRLAAHLYAHQNPEDAEYRHFNR